MALKNQPPERDKHSQEARGDAEAKDPAAFAGLTKATHPSPATSTPNHRKAIRPGIIEL